MPDGTVLADCREALAGRLTMYRFFARLYLSEVDGETLDDLRGMDFPAGTGSGKLDEGFRLMSSWLENPGTDDPVTALAVDYARVFLGTGTGEIEDAAFPYESVYTSPGRLMRQKAWEEVRACYRREGLEADAEKNIPEDHVALEFEFAARLCEKALGLPEDDGAALEKNLRVLEEFLESHVYRWVPVFCGEVRRCCRTDFYAGLSLVTEGYIEIDREALGEFAGKDSRREGP